MRKLTAEWIFTNTQPPIRDGVLMVSEQGMILAIEHRDVFNDDELEYFPGAIVPGFVNAHCHLELSHMKGVVPSGTGMAEFIRQIIDKRNENEQYKVQAAKRMDQEMHNLGIVAVGDILNTADTIPVKKNSSIHYHNFVEIFTVNPARNREVFEDGKKLLAEYEENGLAASLVPHAPYSVDPELFDLISGFNEDPAVPISIHSEESRAEFDFVRRGSGDFAKLFKEQGVLSNDYKGYGVSPLEYILSHIPAKQRTLLVHNTCSDPSAVKKLSLDRKQTHLCLCPNANQYITGELPEWIKSRTSKVNICLGTDSLASNHQLSMISEMLTLQNHFSKITFGEMLKWATIGGARALGLEHKFGTIDIGRKPGLVWVKGLDKEGMKLSEGASSVRIN